MDKCCEHFMDDTNRLYIGWSCKDITPRVPVQLAGQFHERITETVRDPLMATILAIETRDENENKIDEAVMISCDLVAVDKEILDRLRVKVGRAVNGLDRDKILINATHIHTGPGLSGWNFKKREGVTTPEEYAESLLEILTKGVKEAWENRKRGGISSELGFAVLGHNRMILYSDGSAQMYGDSSCADFETVIGPSDHGVEMLFCWDENKKLTGIVINAAVTAQIVENEEYLTADIWGEARKLLKEKYSEDLFILPQSSSAGDQSPRDLVRRNRAEPDMRKIEGVYEAARRILNAVDYVYESAAGKIESNAVLKHHVETVSLPVRKVGRIEAEHAAKEYNRLLADYNIENENFMGDDRLSFFDKYKMFVQKGIMKRFEYQQKSQLLDIELHCIRLGKIAFATNPFELYLEYGWKMKARSKAEQTFVIQLSCGSAGYLPTARAISAEGYSAVTASGSIGSEGGNLLVEHTVKAINRMME